MDHELRVHTYSTIAHDDHSRWTWEWPRSSMTAKTTKPMIDEVVNELRVLDKKLVCAIRLDSGPEFSGAELVTDLRAKGAHV